MNQRTMDLFASFFTKASSRTGCTCLQVSIHDTKSTLESLPHSPNSVKHQLCCFCNNNENRKSLSLRSLLSLGDWLPTAPCALTQQPLNASTQFDLESAMAQLQAQNAALLNHLAIQQQQTKGTPWCKEARPPTPLKSSNLANQISTN